MTLNGENNGAERERLLVAVALLALIATCFVYLALSGKLQPIAHEFWRLFADKEHMRNYVESWGVLAPVIFIVIQAAQVILAPFPGEFTGAVGGFIFGGLPNILYSTIGLTLGSCFAFWAARIIGLPLVKLVVSKKMLNKFQFLTERRGAALALVLYVIPGFPKDVFSYLLGLSPMRFAVFFPICAFGRVPGTILLSFSGSAVYDENWLLLGILVFVCAVALIGIFFYRDKIDLWLNGVGAERAESGELNHIREDRH
jgi:uncharacterized membrane protein YdjX (TVP38/TMEM64 family)